MNIWKGIVKFVRLCLLAPKLINIDLLIVSCADWIRRDNHIDIFIDELNPISSSTARTAAKSSGDIDVMHERMNYQRTISEKTDTEIVALVVKQRTEAALKFQRSVEMSLEQLSNVSTDIESSKKKKRIISL